MCLSPPEMNEGYDGAQLLKSFLSNYCSENFGNIFKWASSVGSKSLILQEKQALALTLSQTSSKF